MTDRELIEAAAKSIDLNGYWDSYANCFVPSSFSDNIYWNPLKEDRDAFRLAVKLNMNIRFESRPDGSVVIVNWPYGKTDIEVVECIGRNIYDSTCLAIVSVASMIGYEK